MPSGMGHFRPPTFNARQPGEGPPPDQLRDQQQSSQGDTKRNRRPLQRKTIDYYGSTVRGLELLMQGGGAYKSVLLNKPDPSYIIDLIPPSFMPDNPITGVANRLIQQAQNKIRCPVNVVKWTPDGRRLITGSSSGEFTMWNGLTFNFETIMQAHDRAIRAMEWSHNGKWLISSDQDGVIKYWLPNLSNVKAFQGHQGVVRDLSFCPTDIKFASASDDGTLKIWDFNEGKDECSLVGHGWDVRCVDWHPQKGLLASGSKDNTVKLWDPRTAQCLKTLHGHHNTVQHLQWNRNGNWIISGGRDQSIRVYDIRKLAPMHAFRTVHSEVSSLAWHPVYENMFASGCSKDTTKDREASDAAIQFWIIGEKEDVATISGAHSSYIWSLAWHPMGHVLASGSNDHSTRFWARARPGDNMPTEITQEPKEDAKASVDDGLNSKTQSMPGISTSSMQHTPPSSFPPTFRNISQPISMSTTSSSQLQQHGGSSNSSSNSGPGKLPGLTKIPGLPNAQNMNRSLPLPPPQSSSSSSLQARPPVHSIYPPASRMPPPPPPPFPPHSSTPGGRPPLGFPPPPPPPPGFPPMSKGGMPPPPPPPGFPHRPPLPTSTPPPPSSSGPPFSAINRSPPPPSQLPGLQQGNRKSHPPPPPDPSLFNQRNNRSSAIKNSRKKPSRFSPMGNNNNNNK
ncbi:WD repeat-containing protein 33 [Mycoemilia scoparia]|uniref:Polyadenylation factor subunit 2 n=1 Tax=Mycoemilia scoparia TaxID=417184 RepID=A0A9W7ZUJ9_9FUNG|nr:WD repeat-containing protein 33 [Mycoemilia scoparia]